MKTQCCPTVEELSNTIRELHFPVQLLMNCLMLFACARWLYRQIHMQQDRKSVHGGPVFDPDNMLSYAVGIYSSTK